MIVEFPFTQPRTLCEIDIGGGSGSSSSTQKQTNQPTVPGFLEPLIAELTSNATNALQPGGGVPPIGSLIQNYPLQQRAPLTANQNTDINAFQNLATDPFALTPMENTAAGSYGGATNVYNSLAGGGPAAGFSASAPTVSTGPNSAENAAQSAFTRFLGGPNVSVPYGEKVFSDITAPTVMSQMSLAGLGNSGAAGENLAMAGEEMALPLAEQGLSMEEAGATGLSSLGQYEQGAGLSASEANARNALAAQGLDLSALGIRTGAMENAGAGLTNVAGGQANLGENQYSQGVTNLKNALDAAGIPQAQQQAILNAQYNQQTGQTQAGLNFQNQILSWLSSLFGNTSNINVQGNTSQGSVGIGL